MSRLWKQINKRLRRLLRKRAGRAAQSSAAILDSQSNKTVDTARESMGFDMGKRVKGRKRHIHLMHFNDYPERFLLQVEFVFDSDENVQKNYEGSYFYRLR